jgi:hypothetical protein
MERNLPGRLTTPWIRRLGPPMTATRGAETRKGRMRVLRLSLAKRASAPRDVMKQRDAMRQAAGTTWTVRQIRAIRTGQPTTAIRNARYLV